MAGKFHDELNELKEEVLKMGYHATNMLSSSVEALINRDEIGIFTEFDRRDKTSQIFKVGTSASILKMFHMPDGGIRLLIQGITRVKILEMNKKSPYIIARIGEMSTQVADSVYCEAQVRSLRSLVKKISSQSQAIPADFQ